MIEQTEISSLRSSLDRAKGLREGVQNQIEINTQEVSRLEKEILALQLVSETFRALIDKEVTIGVKAVERLLTEGLQAVFTDQELRVDAGVELKRGKISVDLLTTQTGLDGVEVQGLSNDSFGGSVSTVQSVLLRIIVILRRNLRRVLFLDESLPAFDADYVSNMGQFLSKICKKIGVDILLVTHNPALVEAADNAYRIARKDGEIIFERINK